MAPTSRCNNAASICQVRVRCTMSVHVIPCLWLFCSPAIALSKRQFRKYFDKEENFIKFHQHASRLIKAPTVAITVLLQSDMVEWLERVGESRAAQWFQDNWTWEHGNYTNATAGYVGNKKASCNGPALKLTGATLGRLQSAPRERISVCACRCSLRRSFAI